MGDASTSPELRILARLGLARLAIVDQLVLVLKRFRAAQLRDLEETLDELPAHVRTHIEAYFDRKLDVKDELERYAQDLLKAVHLLHHLQIEGDARKDAITLVGALGDGSDRTLFIKMVQALGVKRARVLCIVGLQLPTVKLQQEFYRVFAGAENGMEELKSWLLWLDSAKSASAATFEIVMHFLTKTLTERCAPSWLKLLYPLPSTTRVALIERLTWADAPLLKEIGRFHEVTAYPITKLLDLCESFRLQLPVLLSEFTMATTLTLYAKFNSDTLIESVDQAIVRLGKYTVVRLIDTLALEENLRTIQIFFVALVEYSKRQVMASLFLHLPKMSQSRLLQVCLRVAGDPAAVLLSAEGEQQDNGTTSAMVFLVFQFLLEGRLRDVDSVLYKLWAVPPDNAIALIQAMKHYTPEELVLVAEGLEAVDDLGCLVVFLRLFDALLPTLRSTLVDWVLDVPGEAALPLYDMLFRLKALMLEDKLAVMLQMMASLSTADKHVLCSQLLLRPTATDHDHHKTLCETKNDTVVFFLSDLDPSRRHKCIKLLAAIDHESCDTLFFLLRTQRLAEQVALTKLMLSLSNAANGRLLGKLHALESDLLDEFFQLLMLIPKSEYKNLARLLVSQEVSTQQFQDFIHIAANMMNQAASREMVMFAAELPPQYRNMFFAILAECTSAEKGVVMRIVACSARLSSTTLHVFVEQLQRIPWATRSALVEQIRALDDMTHIHEYVVVLKSFEDDALLPRMVHLLALLPLPVRIAIVPLFAQLSSFHERNLALEKLNAMKKVLLPTFCNALCDPVSVSFIGGAFLRMVGYLRDDYQVAMLQLLKWKACWVFIEVLSTSMDSGESRGHQLNDTSNSALVNGLAASLTLLQTEDDYVLLGDVMEEAMGNGIRLEEIIVVLAHFRDRGQLLAFLNYVTHLTRVTKSTLFFRVLSRSQATAFLFEMCHVLDLDDALFALKRLDRMWSRDASSVDRMLLAMAAKGAVIHARDEFCHLVLGYRERAPAACRDADHIVGDRIVAPRGAVAVHQAVTTKEWSWDLAVQIQDEDIDATTAVVVAPLSLRQVHVDRQLHRVQDKKGDARRRNHRRRNNWRDWTDADFADALLSTDEVSSSPRLGSLENGAEAAPVSLPPQQVDCFPENEPLDGFFPVGSNETGALDASETTHQHDQVIPSEGAPPVVSEAPSQAHDMTLLPPLDPASRPLSAHNNRSSTAASAPDTGRAGGLSRSESAPSTLQLAPVAVMSRAKLYRGLAGALALDVCDQHHVSRDRGTSIFHKQCQHASENGPSRIRFARTEAAQSKIMQARVSHAIGRRPTAMASSSSTSSLLRCERRTLEQANTAIQLAQQCRLQADNQINPIGQRSKN